MLHVLKNNTQRKVNGLIKDRKEILEFFSKHCILAYLHPDMNELVGDTVRAFTEELKHTYKTRRETWHMASVGEWFYVIHKFLVLSDSLGEKVLVEPGTMGKCRFILRNCQAKALEEANKELFSNKNKKKKRSDAGIYVGQPEEYLERGETIQHVLHKKHNGNWERLILPMKCGMCGCQNMIPDRPLDEVRRLNQKLKEDYEKGCIMAQKENKPKPPPPKWVQRKAVCMCCVSNCTDDVKFKGCSKCFNDCKKGHPPKVIDGRCQCRQCNCPCDVVIDVQKNRLLHLQERSKRLKGKWNNKMCFFYFN